MWPTSPSGLDCFLKQSLQLPTDFLRLSCTQCVLRLIPLMLRPVSLQQCIEFFRTELHATVTDHHHGSPKSVQDILYQEPLYPVKISTAQRRDFCPLRGIVYCHQDKLLLVSKL